MVSDTNLSSGSRPCRYRSVSIGKSRSGRQSPYQEDLSAPPRPKKSSSGASSRMSGVGTPTSTTVPAIERLQVGLGAADRLDHHVGAVPAGQLLDPLDRVGLPGVDHVGGAELPGPLQLPGVDVHADD